MVGGLGEVSGGYNLQNLAWAFADAPPYAPTISYSLLQIVAMDHLSTMLLTEKSSGFIVPYVDITSKH